MDRVTEPQIYRCLQRGKREVDYINQAAPSQEI
jgi:hypothetical protein